MNNLFRKFKVLGLLAINLEAGELVLGIITKLHFKPLSDLKMK